MRQGKLEEAVRTLNWYAITNEVYPEPAVNGIDIDTFNTKLQGRIASILIMEDTPEKLQYLRSFSRWLDNGCLPAPGLAGSFKPDGACFHHCNNYPAYAVGGLDGATNMILLAEWYRVPSVRAGTRDGEESASHHAFLLQSEAMVAFHVRTHPTGEEA